MAAGKAVRQIKRFVAAQPDRDFQEGLARPRREDRCDRALVEVKAVLVQPMLSGDRLHDVQRNRQRIGRQLRVHVDMGAVEHQLARLQPRTLDKPQRGHGFPPVTRDFAIVELVIVAPVSRPEIAERQEVEVVIVRRSQHEGRPAARADQMILRRWPDIGADKELAAPQCQHDDLRAIDIVQHVLAVPVGQFLDQDIAEKRIIVAQAAQPARRVEQAVLLTRIEALC